MLNLVSNKHAKLAIKQQIQLTLYKRIMQSLPCLGWFQVNQK